MIIYGLTMQGKPEAIPREVATWLFERNSHYPNIDFTVDCWDPLPSQVKEFKTAARKYSRFYSFWNKFVSTRVSGVNVVVFPYLAEKWSVKIVGGINPKGEIADLNLDEVKHPLPATLRAKIAGLPITSKLPSGVEKINENVLGILRKESNPPSERPTEMVPFPSDFKMTSELSLSGEEIEKFVQSANLLLEPDIQKEAECALRSKDWETLKRLQNRNKN